MTTPLTDADRQKLAELQARANAETLTEYAQLEQVLTGPGFTELQAAITASAEAVSDPDDRKKIVAIANVLKAYGGGLIKKIESLKPPA